MSTLSSLIDELNKSADEWNKNNMFELARMCSDAADTIWQLRDDLQRANDAVQDAEHDESRAWDRVRKVEAENAKLRELVRDMYMAMWTCNQYACKHGKDGCYTEDGDNGGKCALRDRMRELVVEA